MRSRTGRRRRVAEEVHWHITGREMTADRMAGSLAALDAAYRGGAAIVRVHDVKAMVRVARMTDAIVRGVL